MRAPLHILRGFGQRCCLLCCTPVLRIVVCGADTAVTLDVRRVGRQSPVARRSTCTPAQTAVCALPKRLALRSKRGEVSCQVPPLPVARPSATWTASRHSRVPSPSPPRCNLPLPPPRWHPSPRRRGGTRRPAADGPCWCPPPPLRPAALPPTLSPPSAAVAAAVDRAARHRYSPGAP